MTDFTRPTSATDCRVFAAACLRLAGQSRDPINKATLISMAAAWQRTLANIPPDVMPSETGSVHTIESKLPPSDPPLLNVSAATTRRLLEIERRNELRRETDLPLLSIAKEIRRMKERDDSQKFSEAFGSFVAQHSKAVWDEVLKPRRESLGDPTWKPKCWSEGVGYQREVYRILRERFEAERN